MAKMNKGPKANVSWVKPAEPSFLKKFKNDVGFKEGPTIDTKRLEMPALEDDSGSDREDELPQVVILKKGDLSAEEVLQIKEVKDGTGKEDKTPADGKILFKKPTKRSSDKFQGITASSNKKKKSEGKSEGGDEEKKEEKSEKKVKNKSLLSFGEDEDED
uniref:KIAA1143 homolog n=1 Tax=Salmo salar TaxID=8030 RepID=B9ELR2_SALSA|nr:KIAA1143 homolog [Salmo salar]